MNNLSENSSPVFEMMLDDQRTLISLGATLSGFFVVGLVLYIVIAVTCLNG